MSGSPVYIDGRLLGAVAYSLGQFSKEPIAGITPIGEMIEMAAAAADLGPRRHPPLPARIRWTKRPWWPTSRDAVRLDDRLPRAWPTCACCPVRPESRLPPSAGSRPRSRSAGSPRPPSAPRPRPRRCRAAGRRRSWRRDRADARRAAAWWRRRRRQPGGRRPGHRRDGNGDRGGWQPALRVRTPVREPGPGVAPNDTCLRPHRASEPARLVQDRVARTGDRHAGPGPLHGNRRDPWAGARDHPGARSPWRTSAAPSGRSRSR